MSEIKSYETRKTKVEWVGTLICPFCGWEQDIACLDPAYHHCANNIECDATFSVLELPEQIIFVREEVVK